MGDRSQCIAKSLQAIGWAVVVLLTVAAGTSFGQAPDASRHDPAPPPSTAVAPEEVATRSAEVANLLITLSGQFASSPEIDKIQQTLPEVSRQIDLDF
ncbi:MAG: hypothetical protein ACM3KE_15785, partial [Hyphomicrobiales bacterium]